MMVYSDRLSDYYLELAQAPNSKASFAGVDMRFSTEYEALETELGKAHSLHGNSQPDWQWVVEKVRPCYVINPRTCGLPSG